jgi:uroporphyrinogen-III decarboxylase
MDSRERVEMAIRFEEPDRVPFSFWMDRRRMAELEEAHGPHFRITHYGQDILESFLLLDFPSGTRRTMTGTSWLEKPLFTVWGDTPAIRLPDPGDEAVYDLVRRDLRAFPGVAVVVVLPNVLTFLEMMLSQEALYADMLEHPDEVQAFFHRISDILAAAAERVCAMDITMLCVADDIGYKNGLMVSRELWREALMPHWRKPIEAAHAAGIPVAFHTDGDVRMLWDDFAALGVHMLNPLQPELQPVGEFKRRFHGRMGVFGGLPTGDIHRMDTREIRATVQHLFAEAGGGGGLVMSTHDIDYSVTEEQLAAMVDAIKECAYG